MGHRSGFTMIESIFALMISSIIMVLIASSFLVLRQLRITKTKNQDIPIMVKQLQQELLEAKNIEVNSNQLTYEKNNQEFMIRFDQQRIVKSIGYEILLFNVDALYFEKEDLIYIKIWRDSQIYRYIIGIGRLDYG